MPTLKELRDSALQHRPSFNPVGRVEIHDATVNSRSKQLSFKGLVLGSKAYPILLVFNGIDFSDDPHPDYPLRIEQLKGIYIYAKHPSISKSSCQLRCQCPDFYFTWQYYDKQVKALAGSPFKKYTRKTTTYPERNPDHLPGYCKHIEGFVKKLASNKFIIP